MKVGTIPSVGLVIHFTSPHRGIVPSGEGNSTTLYIPRILRKDNEDFKRTNSSLGPRPPLFLLVLRGCGNDPSRTHPFVVSFQYQGTRKTSGHSISPSPQSSHRFPSSRSKTPRGKSAWGPPSPPPQAPHHLVVLRQERGAAAIPDADAWPFESSASVVQRSAPKNNIYV